MRVLGERRICSCLVLVFWEMHGRGGEVESEEEEAVVAEKEVPRVTNPSSPESLAEAVAVTLKPDRNTETFFCRHVSRALGRGWADTVSLSKKRIVSELEVNESEWIPTQNSREPGRGVTAMSVRQDWNESWASRPSGD